MKSIAYALLGAFFLLAGCTDDKPVMHIYTWSDYIEPGLIQKFEQENNCSIVIDTFDDNESMMAKLLAGATGYDIVMPSSYIVPVMVRNGLVEELELGKLVSVMNNYSHKFDDHLHEYSFKYSVPYAFSVTGIAYRNDVVSDLPQSWDALMDKRLMNRVSILRDVREMFGVGLRHGGNSVNCCEPEELDKALEYIKKLKACATKMDNEQYRTGLVSKEFYACMGYSADIIQIVVEGQCTNIGFILPAEGSTCCWDEMVITKKSENKALAYKFIDFLYEARNAATNMEYICAAMPNAPAMKYLSPRMQENELINVSDRVIKSVELIKDVGDDIELFNKRWDEFTTNRD